MDYVTCINIPTMDMDVERFLRGTAVADLTDWGLGFMGEPFLC
jgi:hypothetical protein